MTAKSVRVSPEIHTKAKVEAAVRGISLQEMANTALQYFYQLYAAAMDAVETEDTRPLGALLQEIAENE